MENTFSLDPVDFDTLAAQLNSASWEIGALVAPTCEPSDAGDDAEVRS